MRRERAKKRVLKVARLEQERLARIKEARKAIDHRWSRLILYAPNREARENFRLFKPDPDGAGYIL